MNLTEKWETQVAEKLIGRTITKVEYISAQEADDCDWGARPLAIQLDGKIWLTPVADDEGNEGGAIHTNIVELPIIPVIGNTGLIATPLSK